MCMYATNRLWWLKLASLGLNMKMMRLYLISPHSPLAFAQSQMSLERENGIFPQSSLNHVQLLTKNGVIAS